jgi:chemotaxis protein CheD
MIEAAAKRVHIIQGEYKVISDPDVVMTTILGSCVAACLRDPVAGLGGMNHFLLPGTGNVTGGDATRYGVHLMELLINGLLKQGARRDRLEAKIEFWPVSGRARQHPLSGAETQKTVALETRPVPAPKPVANDIEFF